MITQAMILAAGEGTRMRPLTLTTPKPLLTVGDMPLIVWHIHNLTQAGISDIVVNACYLADKIQAFFETRTFDVNISVSVEKFDTPIETAGGVAFALSQNLLKNKPFLLVNGDVWTDMNFGRLVKTDLADNLGHLCLIDNPVHNPNGDFALINGQVKPKDKQNLTFAGISVLSPRLFDGVTIGAKSPLAPILHEAIAQNRLTGECLTDTWVDVGTPQRLDELNQMLLSQAN